MFFYIILAENSSIDDNWDNCVFKNCLIILDLNLLLLPGVTTKNKLYNWLPTSTLLLEITLRVRWFSQRYNVWYFINNLHTDASKENSCTYHNKTCHIYPRTIHCIVFWWSKLSFKKYIRQVLHGHWLKIGKTRCRIDDIQTSMYIIVSHYFFLLYLIILQMARFPNDKKTIHRSSFGFT